LETAAVIVPFLDASVFRPAVMDAWIDARSISGGVTVTGDEQVIGLGMGLWRVTAAGIPIKTRADALEYRRFVAALDGRANTTLVPFLEKGRAPWGKDAHGRTISMSFFSRGWLAAGEVPNLISASLSGSYTGQQAAVTIQMSPSTVTMFGTAYPLTPSAPSAGNVFSVNNRAHIISQVAAEVGANLYSVLIRPPLKEAMTDPPIDFVNPVCEMRLATDEQARFALQGLRLGSMALEFIEA